jgi:hypothetical protein
MMKLRNRIFTAAGAAALLTLSACGASSGVVVDKTHNDDYYMVTYSACGPNLKSQCPQITYIPDSWYVIVKQDDDGKVKSSEVSQTMFDRCPIGARWVRPAKGKGHCDV